MRFLIPPNYKIDIDGRLIADCTRLGHPNPKILPSTIQPISTKKTRSQEHFIVNLGEDGVVALFHLSFLQYGSLSTFHIPTLFDSGIYCPSADRGDFLVIR